MPLYGNGRVVWEQLIRPSGVDLERVMAHQCMNLLYQPSEARTAVYCFDLETQDLTVRHRPGLRLAVGRIKVCPG